MILGIFPFWRKVADSAHYVRFNAPLLASLAGITEPNLILAEGSGFEPLVQLAPHTRFPSVRLKPLGQPSLHV